MRAHGKLIFPSSVLSVIARLINPTLIPFIVEGLNVECLSEGIIFIIFPPVSVE